MSGEERTSGGARAPGSDDAAMHRSKGAALFRQRRFTEAAEAFAAWVREAPQNPLAEFCRARALLRSGERRAAKEACRRAVACDPNLVRGHLLLTRLALDQKKLGQAQSHLKNALAVRPEAATLHAMMARILMLRSRFEAAIAAAQEALSCDPGCHSAALVLAELYQINGDKAKSASVLSKSERQGRDWPEARALRRRLPAQREGRPPLPNGESAPPNSGDQIMRMSASAGSGLAAAALQPSTAYAHSDLFDQIFLIRALILRELRLHYRGTRLGFLLEYVRPIIVMALHYVVFTAIGKKMPAKIPTELFILGSFTTWYATSHVIRGTMSDRRTASPAPGVTEIHVGLAKTVWEFLSMLSLLFACLIILMLLGWQEPIPNIPRTVLYFAIAAPLGWGIGLNLQALARKFPATETLQKSVLWIMFITSGHYFSISGGHHGLWEFVWYNPSLHLAELQRNAFDPGYPTQLVNIWYPIACTAGLLTLGLILNRCTRHLARE